MRASQAASVIIISSKDISSISSSFGSPGACRGLAARRARRVEPFLGTSLNLPNGLGFPGLARGRPAWADIRSGPGAGRGSAPQSSRDAVGRSRRLHAGCTTSVQSEDCHHRAARPGLPAAAEGPAAPGHLRGVANVTDPDGARCRLWATSALTLVHRCSDRVLTTPHTSSWTASSSARRAAGRGQADLEASHG